MYCDVEFGLTSPEWDAKMIHSFLKSRRRQVLKHHPELRGKEHPEAVEEYVKKEWEEKKPEIEQRKGEFEERWREIEEEVMEGLSKVMETPWPEDRTITVEMSLNPVSPRFLDTWETTLYYKRDLNVAMNVLAHEITHFIYFKKWKEVYPETDREEMEFPSLIWHLSELLVPVIFSDEELKNIFNGEISYYDQFKRREINGETLAKHFKEIYRENKKQGGDFEDFLRKAYKEAKEHRETVKFKENEERKVKNYLDSAWKEYNKERGLEADFEKDRRFFTEQEDEEIIGAVVVELMGGICHIKDMVVSKGHRREGVGEKLFKQVEELAREKQCRKITVKTHEENKASLEFYKKQGMTQDVELENYQFGINWYYFSKEM